MATKATIAKNAITQTNISFPDLSNWANEESNKYRLVSANLLESISDSKNQNTNYLDEAIRNLCNYINSANDQCEDLLFHLM